MIKDRNIGYQYKREWFSVTNFNCWHVTGGVLTCTTTGSAEIAQTAEGLTGAKFTGTGNLAAMVMPKPSGWDFDNDIFVRALWSDQGASDSSVTFEFLWRNFSFGAANATPTGTLTTVIEADRHGEVNDGVNATRWGKLGAGTITPVTSAESFVRFDVKLTADGGNIDPVFLGLEVAYIPKLTSGSQVSDQAAPTDA